MKDCRESMERALKVCFAWGKPPCQVGGRCASSRLRLTAVCSFGQEFFCRQASAVPAWGKPPCQAGGRCASSRLRLTAVCPFGQEFFCRQASAVPAWGKPPCQAGGRCASSRLRLTAVCPFSRELFCKQACDRVPDRMDAWRFLKQNLTKVFADWPGKGIIAWYGRLIYK